MKRPVVEHQKKYVMQNIKKNFETVGKITTEYLMLVVLFGHGATRTRNTKDAPTTKLSHSQEKKVAALPYQGNALKSFTQSHIVPKHRKKRQYQDKIQIALQCSRRCIDF